MGKLTPLQIICYYDSLATELTLLELSVELPAQLIAVTEY